MVTSRDMAASGDLKSCGEPVYCIWRFPKEDSATLKFLLAAGVACCTSSLLTLMTQRSPIPKDTACLELLHHLTHTEDGCAAM
jgi:hypothetical protein